MNQNDSQKLSRTAQYLAVEFRHGYGSPPVFENNWQPLWDAKVDRVEINAGSNPSQATIWFPSLHWHEGHGLLWGDQVRIRTDETRVSQRTILFTGYVTSYLSDFSGGSEKRGSSFERNAVVAQDARWLLSTTCPVFGQYTRGPDDYTGYGTDSQAPITNSCMFASALRTIFNKNGKPNMDATFLQLPTCQVSIFADSSVGTYWSAREMIIYLLAVHNYSSVYFPIDDPRELTGLAIANKDFDKVLNHISVDGLNLIQAVEYVCRQIGYSLRLEYYNDGTETLCFYKLGAARGYARDTQNQPVILHQLHAPAVGEDITAAVEAGKTILWAMNLAEDIAGIVNNPWGLGAPDQFEITAELVPAWLDTDFVPYTTDLAKLFLSDSELQKETAPDTYDFYKYYHPRGSLFKRDVGRKWALNEAGTYTPSTTYNRGVPFKFEDYIAPKYILRADGKRMYAPVHRQLLPALTLDKQSKNSVGIKVEFSFDSGLSWQVIQASIANLEDECGIYLEEPNLSEMTDKAEGSISGGTLDGVALNLFSSLADDKVNTRAFKDGAWHTRVRVTASIQLDQRMRKISLPSPASGSPFFHSQLFDFSEKYGLKKRQTCSTFTNSNLPSFDVDSSDYFSKHMDSVRRANEDMSISGQFTLERLWLGDGRGIPDFYVGDGIEKITGREYELAASIADRTVFPEIIKIVYLPDRQKMQLITRDLRFAARSLY